MRKGHGDRALLVAFMALSACADPANRIAGPTTLTADVQTGTVPTEERAALTRIAQLVAVAMDNEPARQHLKRDMRAAPFREHKLQLTEYLRSRDGKALLARMTETNGGSEADLFAIVNAVRPLEFYMPAPNHREKWNGKADVIVLSQLEQSSPLVAFDKNGRTVSVSRDAPPDQPVLALIPVETNFSAPMNPVKSRNVRDANGDAIGTLEPVTLKVSSVVACDAYCGEGGDGGVSPVSDGGGGGGGGSSIDPGLYLEFSRILDAKEPWFRGDPEIEVHIHGPRDARTSAAGEDLSCAAEHAFDSRKYFDQNAGFWEGRAMLLSADEIRAYNAKYNNEGYLILFWEDDNQPCTLKYDANVVNQAVKAAAGTIVTVAIKVLTQGPWWTVPAIFLGTFFDDPASTLLTNDDFLGTAVMQDGFFFSYPDNTHVILDGNQLNGRATIRLRQ